MRAYSSGLLGFDIKSFRFQVYYPSFNVSKTEVYCSIVLIKFRVTRYCIGMEILGFGLGIAWKNVLTEIGGKTE